jgi:hypothetical protein
MRVGNAKWNGAFWIWEIFFLPHPRNVRVVLRFRIDPALHDRIILYWSKFRVSEIKYIEKFGGRVLADFKVVFIISKDICST